MSNIAVSTAGGAMLKINRASLMARAWAIFRQTYRYPQIKFSDIGRPCFAWALKQEWAEARAAARLAALSPATNAERITTLHLLIAHAEYIDHWPSYRASLVAYRDELSQLRRKEVNELR